MKREGAFWDASALVPICVHEAGSRFARQQLRRFATVVWWGSGIEVYSAICRLHRRRYITEQEKREAAGILSRLKQFWNEVQPSDELQLSAHQMLDKHALRAGDSMQLAAALVWCVGRPAKRVFLCADERLSEAARAEGFEVVELPKNA